MNKGLITLGVIGFIFLLIGFNACNSRNQMVVRNENVTATWKQVEVAYQRRMDLIPNIVQTVQGYADFEKSTLVDVTNARANATKITIDPSKLDEESMQKFEQAQGAISSTLGRLLAVAENYPDLKANEGFNDLRVELEGTENRIAKARNDFNDVVRDYNTYIQIFPRSIWAGLFHFNTRPYFSAQEGADQAPKVKFDFKDNK